jgi:hypothetical protein
MPFTRTQLNTHNKKCRKHVCVFPILTLEGLNGIEMQEELGAAVQSRCLLSKLELVM